MSLLINPDLKSRDVASYQLILKKWKDIYLAYSNTFSSLEYKTHGEPESVVTDVGLLNIKFQPEMKGYYILIATPVIPNVRTLLSPKENTETMFKEQYLRYFQENRKHSIITFQDTLIQEHVDILTSGIHKS